MTRIDTPKVNTTPKPTSNPFLGNAILGKETRSDRSKVNATPPKNHINHFVAKVWHLGHIWQLSHVELQQVKFAEDLGEVDFMRLLQVMKSPALRILEKTAQRGE